MLPEGLFLREDGVVDVARTPNGVRTCAIAVVCYRALQT